MKRAVPVTLAQAPLWPMLIALMAMSALLAGCGDVSPSYGPASVRDSAGRPVDPVYGTVLPGWSMGTGGGGM
jgi:hypothetical protein